MIFRCLGIIFNYKICANYLSMRFSSTVASATGDVETRAQALSNALQCSYKTALLMIGKNKKILFMDSCDLENAVSFCKKNFRTSDVIECPSVITLPTRLLDNRLQSLHELGFKRVSTNQIVRFQKGNAKSKDTFESLDIENAIANHFGGLRIPPSEMSRLKSEVVAMQANSHSLMAIKCKLNLSFLKWRLQVSDEKLEKASNQFTKFRFLNLKNMNATINVLTEKCQLSLSKIAQNPLVLTISSSQLENLLQTMPSILGVDIKTLLQKNPTLCTRVPVNIRKVEKLLQAFGFTSNQLLCCPKILNLKPFVIKQRLQTLRNTTEFEKFKAEENFLLFVCRYKQLSSRIPLLKLTKSPYNFKILLLSSVAFRKLLRSENCSTFGKEIAQYLSKIFNCSFQSVRQVLKEYPALNNFTVVNAQDVIDFLLRRGISKEQLWNGLGIIAYDKELVEHFFNNLPCYEEFQPFSEWMGHFNLVQLLIYAIERHKNSVSAIPEVSLVNEIANDDDDEEADCIADHVNFDVSDVDYFSEDEEEISDMYKI